MADRLATSTCGQDICLHQLVQSPSEPGQSSSCLPERQPISAFARWSPLRSIYITTAKRITRPVVSASSTSDQQHLGQLAASKQKTCRPSLIHEPCQPLKKVEPLYSAGTSNVSLHVQKPKTGNQATVFSPAHRPFFSHDNHFLLDLDHREPQP